MPERRIFLVRHGETEWTKSGQHTGRSDIVLTEAGREQGRLLTDRLQMTDFSLVLSSPLQRAMETCRLAGLLDRAELSQDLREWDYGDYEGRTTAEIRQSRPGWSVWADGAPKGESADQVGVRADRVIERVRNVDGDVLLFGHGHMLRVLGARWVGLPASGGSRLALSTASVCVLSYERETPVIHLWNGRAHLSQLD